jgi:predicted  nucleic acid-binding Zn-ribbon protein
MPVYLWVLLVLAVLAGVYVWMHLNYQKKIQSGEFCPKCGGNKFHRLHRHSSDRIFGIGLSARRYRCANSNCGWEGVRQYYPRPKSWKKSVRRSDHVRT